MSASPGSRAWIVALSVTLALALTAVAWLLVERSRLMAAHAELRDELRDSLAHLQDERRAHREAVQALQLAETQRLALEGQLDVLIADLGAGLAAPRRDAADASAIGRLLDETLTRGIPPEEAVARLDERTVRDVLWNVEQTLIAAELRDTVADGDGGSGSDSDNGGADHGLSGKELLHAALLARYGRNRPTLARALLDRAIAADPTLVEAYVQRAALKFETGDAVRARTDVRIAVNLQPNHWRGWALLGRLAAADGDAEAAAEALARAHAYAPEAYRDRLGGGAGAGAGGRREPDPDASPAAAADPAE